MKRIISSPVGNILLQAEGGSLTALEFTKDKVSAIDVSTVLDLVETELSEYFAGKRREFSLKVSQQGTPFQEKVWAELSRIPYGTTISYGELARRIGNPKACRACGSANGKNHIAIIVPCHRVIHQDDSLGGFSGGPGIKNRLLELEGAKFKMNQPSNQMDQM
jgi:methylated-DNA-[protein]-cysteine S-methyltransferase